MVSLEASRPCQGHPKAVVVLTFRGREHPSGLPQCTSLAETPQLSVFFCGQGTPEEKPQPLPQASHLQFSPSISNIPTEAESLSLDPDGLWKRK